MARRGRKRQLDVESRYWFLLASGVGTVEACKLLGIGRKTGYRWRADNGGVPPDRLDEASRSNRYLSKLERQRIATLRQQGLGVREIARRLDRSASTVSRELRRNIRKHDRCYDADLAHARARQRAHRRRPSRLARDADLRAVVKDKLELEWSPEQVCGWLRETFTRRDWWLCPETVYQAVYRGVLDRRRTAKLRTGRPLRKRRRRPTERSPRFISPGALLDQRPAVVEDRVRVGDWEGDLIVGQRSRSAIGTLVDRRSGLVRLIHLPDGHTADALVAAVRPVMAGVPERARLTLTWDQGSEMASHHEIAEHFLEGVFFAPPGTPWLRGTNENTNGLVRQYFPKGADLRRYTVEDLRRVEDRLNGRPRKRLGWKTPADIFRAAMPG